MHYDSSDHVPLAEITPEHWLVYLGSQTSAHGWAHILIGDETSEKLVLCAHPERHPGGILLSRVNQRSVYHGEIAEGLAKRMKFRDPRPVFTHMEAPDA